VSTIGLQDIVEGQQRATNGLITLLSQERTTAESNTREGKQQLSNLTSLSQHFLIFTTGRGEENFRPRELDPRQLFESCFRDHSYLY
jgi:hypothetical protein